jgi:hypothetical protein
MKRNVLRFFIFSPATRWNITKTSSRLERLLSTDYNLAVIEPVSLQTTALLVEKGIAWRRDSIIRLVNEIQIGHLTNHGQRKEIFVYTKLFALVLGLFSFLARARGPCLSGGKGSSGQDAKMATNVHLVLRCKNEFWLTSGHSRK